MQINMPSEHTGPVWNVMYENFNTQKIEWFNVFDHGGFVRSIEKANEEYPETKDFLAQLANEVRYYFWAKCEWEILVGSTFENAPNAVKKDVSDQLLGNWKAFTSYVLQHFRPTNK